MYFSLGSEGRGLCTMSILWFPSSLSGSFCAEAVPVITFLPMLFLLCFYLFGFVHQLTINIWLLTQQLLPGMLIFTSQLTDYWEKGVFSMGKHKTTWKLLFKQDDFIGWLGKPEYLFFFSKKHVQSRPKWIELLCLTWVYSLPIAKIIYKQSFIRFCFL